MCGKVRELRHLRNVGSTPQRDHHPQKAMADNPELAHVEVLLDSVTATLGRRPPDHLLRMCVRFWMSADPPLVEKVRSHYLPIRPARLAQAARRAWQQLGDNTA